MDRQSEYHEYLIFASLYTYHCIIYPFEVGIEG
jgi:hypothetical protein